MNNSPKALQMMKSHLDDSCQVTILTQPSFGRTVLSVPPLRMQPRLKRFIGIKNEI